MVLLLSFGDLPYLFPRIRRVDRVKSSSLCIQPCCRLFTFQHSNLSSMTEHQLSSAQLTSVILKSNSSVSGTSTMPTSLIFAQTLYIPYVGGVVIIASSPGLQKILISKSIASSLPTPTKIFLDPIFPPR